MGLNATFLSVERLPFKPTAVKVRKKYLFIIPCFAILLCNNDLDDHLPGEAKFEELYTHKSDAIFTDSDGIEHGMGCNAGFCYGYKFMLNRVSGFLKRPKMMARSSLISDLGPYSNCNIILYYLERLKTAAFRSF